MSTPNEMSEMEFANLSEGALQEIKKLENELSSRLHEDVVLLAYTEREEAE